MGRAERIREDQAPDPVRRERVPGRAVETRTSERTLYRKVATFRDEGMGSLFASLKAKRRVLPPAICGTIVDLKAKHRR